MRRIVGIDVARGLAVLGMMTAHVGPDDHGPVPPGGFAQLADGRPSALFVVLAGVSLALISGADEPVTGTRLVQARTRVLVRAALLLLLGQLLLLLGTPIAVILSTYAVLFAVGCVALRSTPATLVTVAVLVALAGPLVRTLLVDVLGEARVDATPLARLALGHFYPAIIWLAYLLAGLALGRSDLRSTRLRGGVALAGAGLVVVGHVGGWVARDVLGWPDALVTTEPHSSTTFEVVGNTGVALLVVVACLVVGDRWPRAVAPLAAVGALALTAYVGHILVIAALGPAVVREPQPGTWLAFLGVTVGLCWLWRATVGRGPLELALHVVSTRTADLRPDRLEDDVVRVPRD